MPRLPPALLREARSSHVLLPLLLRECRDLPSARNELRWLNEHAYQSHGLPSRAVATNKSLNHSESSIHSMVWQTFSRNVLRRSKGEPIQYILGTQPFGNLEILCREGVLIPRPETEAYTARLGSILKKAHESDPGAMTRGDTLRILDLCSGTGCIPLLLHSILKPVGGKDRRKLKILGVDISDTALTLSRENLEYNVGESLLDLSAISDISFKRASVFDFCESVDGAGLEKSGPGTRSFDVLVSNPPYVSDQDYRPGGSTSRSVRRYEPKIALVPDPAQTRDMFNIEHGSGAYDGDVFYHPMIEIARKIKASIAIFEIGDDNQALRVHQMAVNMHRGDDASVFVELWDDDAEDIDLDQSTGQRARAVVIWTGKAAQLRKAERKRGQ